MTVKRCVVARRSLRAGCVAVLTASCLTTAPTVAAHAQVASDASVAIRPAQPSFLTLHPPARPDEPGGPSASVVAGQVALGTLATPVGYLGGGLATRWTASKLGASDEAARRLAYVGAYTGAALTTAATVEYLGRTSRVGGSFPAVLGGAFAGELASWGVVELGRSLYGDSPGCNFMCNTLGAAAFVLPAVGATVAHSLSRDWR